MILQTLTHKIYCASWFGPSDAKVLGEMITKVGGLFNDSTTTFKLVPNPQAASCGGWMPNDIHSWMIGAVVAALVGFALFVWHAGFADESYKDAANNFTFVLGVLISGAVWTFTLLIAPAVLAILLGVGAGRWWKGREAQMAARQTRRAQLLAAEEQALRPYVEQLNRELGTTSSHSSASGTLR